MNALLRSLPKTLPLLLEGVLRRLDSESESKLIKASLSLIYCTRIGNFRYY